MGRVMVLPEGRGDDVKWVGVAPGFCLEEGVAMVVLASGGPQGAVNR